MYPDFLGLDRTNLENTRVVMGNIINNLYGSSVFGSSMDAMASPTSAPGPPDHGMWNWTVRVEVKKYELGCSFCVLIFLGEAPENSEEWRICPNFVGGHHAFVNSVASRCANCSNQQDVVIEGFVHLNPAIVKLSGLESLEPSDIEPYLTDNLYWKVLKVFSSFLFFVCECVLIIFLGERRGSRTGVP